jgi:hypothetical protein
MPQGKDTLRFGQRAGSAAKPLFPGFYVVPAAAAAAAGRCDFGVHGV